MAEEKKRFPWWVPASAVSVAIFALVFAFIEIVGRRGTLVDRYKLLTKWMSEADVLAILGPPDTTKEANYPDRADPPADMGAAGPDPLRSGDGPAVTRSYTWREGPAEVSIIMMRGFHDGPAFPNRSGGWWIAKKRLVIDERRLPMFGWLRLWARKAYTAIHAPPRQSPGFGAAIGGFGAG
jgi:hypothetical protein